MWKLAAGSLRGKFLLFAVVLVVVPGTIVAVLAIAGARAALEVAVGRQLAEVAHDTAAEFSELLSRQSANVRSWARQDLMREVVIGDLDKHISRFLFSLKEGDTGYVDLLCVDAGGHAVAASNPALLGKSHADRDWYRAISAGQTVARGPVVLPEHAQPVLEFAAPIYDPDAPGSVVGGLLGVYDWQRGVSLARRIQRNIAALKLTVDVLLLDADGVVIADAAGQRLQALAGQNLRTAGWLAAAPRLSRRLGYMREARADVLVGYARLKDARPDWTALVVQPLGEALSPVSHLQLRLALLLTSVLLVASGVAILFAERMNRPLRELTRATQEIARAGEPRRPVPVRSRDEIGQLAVAFNRMAGELKRAQDDLVGAAKFAFVGEVAAGIAHEIRTPLGILRGSAQILGRSIPAERTESRELVDMIISEADRLDRVVAGLLELARPHEPLLAPNQLAPILARALDFIEAQARAGGIAVRRDLGAAQRPACCDAEQVYQVALNLIVNALQILPRGGELSVRTLPSGNGRVAFEVTDNGPGIPPHIGKHIFTPFFTMREGGTGLGLALVQGVVQAHKGTVTLDSVEGRGTTFRVDLPAAEDA